MSIGLAFQSRQGGRASNEDACGHWHADAHLCCVVADGAGGHGGGDKASKLAVRSVVDSYAQTLQGSEESIRGMLQAADRCVIAHRGSEAGTLHMYSTVVALFVDLQRHIASWGHCGDSRLYAFRGGRLRTRTRDHSMVQALIDNRTITEDRARSHPRRSELFSALGVGTQDLRVDVSSQPWLLEDGDAFLLCTDGLWEFVDDAQLEASLAEAASPSDWLHGLEGLVLTGAIHKPRHDNFSALAMWVTER